MILYTDIEPFCCEVLRARVADGGLLPGDVWERDVRTLTADELKPYTQVHLFCGIGASPLGLKWAGWPAELSVVTGGFPCQDISVAGKGAGISGKDSALYIEALRVVDVFRPCYAIMENSPALLGRGLGDVLGDLAAIGYDAEWTCFPASAVGSPQSRDRIWIVAYPESEHGQSRDLLEACEVGGASAQPRRLAGLSALAERQRSDFGWAAEPDVDRVADGLPGWMDRLHALGNAQVPQVVSLVARAILSYEATASERSGT